MVAVSNPDSLFLRRQRNGNGNKAKMFRVSPTEVAHATTGHKSGRLVSTRVAVSDC